MKINEISRDEREWLTLKQIEYDFDSRVDDVITAYKFSGNDPTILSLIGMQIDIIQNRMNILFDEGFDSSDPDIIHIRNLYANLIHIKNQL